MISKDTVVNSKVTLWDVQFNSGMYSMRNKVPIVWNKVILWVKNKIIRNKVAIARYKTTLQDIGSHSDFALQDTV